MKVTYTAYTAVAEWKWDLPEEADDTCGICRVQFEGTCARCKFPGDECPILIGECRHCFHAHCINDWLRSDSSQNKCPMCRQEFKQKIASTTAGSSNAQTLQEPPPQAPVTPTTSGP